MSNGGAVAGAVSDGEKLATVRAFAQEFFDGLEEEPLGERDLSGAACAFAADGCDDDFLGGAGKCGEREGFEFGGGLGAAQEGFNAGDFVEVGHAGGGVSKWFNHGGHGEHGGENAGTGARSLFRRGLSGVSEAHASPIQPLTCLPLRNRGRLKTAVYVRLPARVRASQRLDFAR